MVFHALRTEDVHGADPERGVLENQDVVVTK